LHRTFVWNSITDWKAWLFDQIPIAVRSELLEQCRKRHSEFRYVDDECLACKFCSEFTNAEELVASIQHKFESTYSCIRMFHCCRPTAIDSYYRDGIKVLDIEYANKLFKSFLTSIPELSSITDDHLQHAFNDMGSPADRHGHVYFGLDDRFLIKHCPHYLQYGSEYFQALAIRIDKIAGTDTKGYLRLNGKPTVFVADIPTSDINLNDMQTLASAMLTTCLYNHAHGTDVTYEMDFGISLRADLAPSRIIEHFHPTDAEIENIG
jgi:hypothetical protein